MPERYRNAAVKAVARSHAWFDDLVSGQTDSVRAIARREGLSPRAPKAYGLSPHETRFNDWSLYDAGSSIYFVLIPRRETQE